MVPDSNDSRNRMATSGIVVLVIISNAVAGRTRCANSTEKGGDTVGKSLMPAPGEPRRRHRRSGLALGDHDHVVLVWRSLAEPLVWVRDVAQEPRIMLE